MTRDSTETPDDPGPGDSCGDAADSPGDAVDTTGTTGDAVKAADTRAHERRCGPWPADRTPQGIHRSHRIRRSR
ncbi:hypothetical protein ACWGLF_29310 [Streptomyces puniciscabiei]